MDAAEPAAASEASGTKPDSPCRFAVMLGGSAGTGRGYRVDAPDRVHRIWALLSSADTELRQVTVPPEVTARLGRQLDAIRAELARSLSPALAGELHNLTGPGNAAGATADELRVQYASLLGWTSGLVAEILSQLEAAAKEMR